MRQLVDLVVSQHRAGCDPFRLRNMILVDYSQPADFTYVLCNVGFILLGMLYGKGFGESICMANNCGYDTDCTAATLGALLGIMHGKESLEQKWLDPIGDTIVAGWGVKDFKAPKDITDLTEQTRQIALAVEANEAEVRRHLARWTNLDFLRSAKRPATMPPASLVTLAYAKGLTLRLDYLDTPSIEQGQKKSLELVLDNESDAARSFEVHIGAPKGLELSHSGMATENGGWKLSLSVPASQEKRIRLDISTAAHGALEANPRLEFRILEGNAEVLKAEAGLIAKSLWLVTRPIASNETDLLGAIEAQGLLPFDKVESHIVKLKCDSFEPLIPEAEYVVFAQTEFQAEEEMRVRVQANTTGRMKVFFEGAVVADKPYRSTGLVPSCHLQTAGHVLLPPNAFADVTLKKGRNRIMLRLTGETWAQDTNFHLMRVRESADENPKTEDFIPLTGASNVALQG